MHGDRQLVVARISAEASASAHLAEVCQWLIDGRANPVHLGLDAVPAIGQDCWLVLARPITAPRALLCTLWLLEDLDASGCLLAGQLRFVAHPTASLIRMSFHGGSAMVFRDGPIRHRANHAAQQVLGLIAESIEGSFFARAS
jgi:hypothetical protein